MFPKHLVAIVVLFGFVNGVAAAEPPLRLPELIAKAVGANPELRSVRELLRSKEQRPSQEGALPDPRLGVGSTNMSSPVPFTKVGEDPQANAAVTIRQEIPFPGKRDLRSARAFSEAQAERARLEAMRLGLIRQVSEAYYEYVYLYQSGKLLKERRKALLTLVRAAQLRYEGGKGSPQEVRRAELEASIAEAKGIANDQAMNGVMAELRRLSGNDGMARYGAPEPITIVPLTTPLDLLVALALERNPEISMSHAEIETRDAEVSLAKREFYPDFDVGASWGYAGDLPDMWQVMLEMRIPLFHRAKQGPALEAARSLLGAARLSGEAARVAVTQRMTDAYGTLQASRQLISLYRARILPAVSQTALSMREYEAGRDDFSTIFSTILSVGEHRLGLVEQEVKYAVARARIEELAGGGVE